MKDVVYGLNLEEAEQLFKTLGAPRFRARQLCEWLYQKHMGSWKEARTLPASLRDPLAARYELHGLKFDSRHPSDTGESVKFLFRTRDGDFLESVLILQRDRRTVCVSTQLGCKIGCLFCASGKGRFLRNLTAGEILEQMTHIVRETKSPVTNVVFMGMGEPLDNFEAVMKALKILQAPWAMGLSSRRITVSTSGITPKMLEFVRREEGRVRLSVSLHSTDERVRTRLVPINKKYSLRELEKTLREIVRTLKRHMTFEYTLIPGINDSEKEIKGLIRLAKPLAAKVNIIPYNPIAEFQEPTPTPAQMESFQKKLEKGGLRATVRQTAGKDINAACGQLRQNRKTGD